MTNEYSSRYLSDLPLWRLLVMLDDAERCNGPDSPASQMLVRLIRERLKGDNDPVPVRFTER